jgi:nicotinic acid mononucleotide adenylyltransferase
MAITRNATKKPTTKGNDSVVPKKKKHSSKHEPPSSSLTKGDTKTKGSGNIGMYMNRAARRKKLKEDGMLIDRNDSNYSSKQTTTGTTAAPAATYTAVQDQQSQGEKIYACLNSNCIETFELWQTARNHMNNCKAVGDRHEGKPKIKDSRKRGNQLLEEGKATLTVYPPLPPAEELATAIRDFHSNNKKMKTSGKGSLMDVAVIMRRVIRPRWGFALKEFATLGYGTWEEFLDANDICAVEDEDADEDEDASVEDADEDEVADAEQLS